MGERRPHPAADTRSGHPREPQPGTRSAGTRSGVVGSGGGAAGADGGRRLRRSASRPEDRARSARPGPRTTGTGSKNRTETGRRGRSGTVGARPRTTSAPRTGPTLLQRLAARQAAARKARLRRGPLRVPLASSTRRLHAFLVVVAVGLSLCGGRLLQLQGFDSSAYAATSAGLLTRTLPLLPSRGEITDRNGAVLASTQPAVAVTADPTLTGPKALQVAEIVGPYLGMTTAELVPLLTTPDTHFVYLKKKVPALTYSALATALSEAGIYGVFRESDPIRTYPASEVGSTVVGFVGADGQGLAGMEYQLDSLLAGVEGTETYESAPNGSKIPLGASSTTPAQNGANVQLTLDSELQYVAQQRLAAQIAKAKADWGFAITMDVTTGEVLAIANAPTFDSADPQSSDPDDRGNRAVSSPYEPGSVEKVLTAAALIDSGTATPETKVEIPSRLATGGGSLKDHFEHGTLRLNLRGVVANSSNIGTALLTRQLAKSELRDYLAAFGLGSSTGIQVPGESAGILPRELSDSQRDQIAFGQALAVTGIQEAAAISAAVNGGVYHAPTVVRSITDGTGAELPTGQDETRRVISAASSAQVRDLMAAVVDSPNGQRNLRLDAYDSGGKTGTAQRADPDCGCYRGYVTSYVGFAPLNDPKLLTYVVVSNPRKGDTGTGVAAPVYQDVMNMALPRYGVAPDATERTALPTTW